MRDTYTLRDLKKNAKIALSDGAQDWDSSTLLEELADVRQGEEDEEGHWHPDVGDYELNRDVCLTKEGIYYVDDRGNPICARPDFEIRHGLWVMMGSFKKGKSSNRNRKLKGSTQMPKSISTKKEIVKSAQDTFSSKEYTATLADLKKHIKECQLKAVTAVNKELVRLYWTIGKIIVEKQQTNGWGTSVIEKLAKDLQNEFPGVEGFSRANVFRMKAFFSAYEKVAQAVRQFEDLPIFGIPWGHNILLIQRIKKDEERLWYANKTIEHGWSRSILETWMESDLYNREGKALTNFKQTLPAQQSDLAQQALKDPYLFDFLTMHKNHLEKDLEDGLVQHIQKFLIELGHGFAFMGQQYPVVVDGDTSYIDLLFYHVKLRAFLVVEIKARAFKPEDVGQLNFYLSAVDDILKHPNDNPTIGILLCKTRNKVKAEYAFRHIHRPMGVVEYETMLTQALPEDLKSSLPTIKEIEEELEKD